MKNFQAIFQSQNGDKAKRDGWLDYCRETAPGKTIEQAQAWADKEALSLSRRIGVSCRARIEVW